MIVSEEIYLEHYGVQGMKWGRRRAVNKARMATLQGQGLTKRQAKGTVRFQNQVDRQKMAAMGRQGKVNALQQLSNRATANRMLSLGTILKHPLSTKKASALQLEKNKVTQARIAAGQKRATALLLRMQGVSMKDIDFNT